MPPVTNLTDNCFEETVDVAAVSGLEDVERNQMPRPFGSAYFDLRLPTSTPPKTSCIFPLRYHLYIRADRRNRPCNRASWFWRVSRISPAFAASTMSSPFGISP